VREVRGEKMVGTRSRAIRCCTSEEGAMAKIGHPSIISESRALSLQSAGMTHNEPIGRTASSQPVWAMFAGAVTGVEAQSGNDDK
jgi:hypothetical protein